MLLGGDGGIDAGTETGSGRGSGHGVEGAEGLAERGGLLLALGTAGEVRADFAGGGRGEAIVEEAGSCSRMRTQFM